MAHDRHERLVFRGGRIVDGTGGPARPGDLAVADGRIEAVGDPAPAPGAVEIDATGRVVAPGFIDCHTHDDQAVLASPAMTAKLAQGVTTVIVGNCGISLAPFRPPETLREPGAGTAREGRAREMPPPLNLLGNTAAYRFPDFAAYVAAVEAARPAVNVAALVGHTTLRVETMPDTGRPAGPAERAAMRTRLRAALEAGATGFSTGLFYKPAAAADIGEVVDLARVMAQTGGVYVTHMRDEHDGVLDSLDETFATARRAGVPVIVSHHKCAGPANHGRSRETLPRFEAACQNQEVALDAYPYTAGSTVLDPDMIHPDVRVLVAWSKPYPALAGQDLATVADRWGCDRRAAARRLHPAGGIYFQMDEADVRRILAWPPTMIGSDGLPHDSHPHPRLWGTFPRVLGHYARDAGLMSLETAIHKMTGLTADTFGLHGRGTLRPGAAADIVMFDPDRIIDRATYADPCRPPAGIDLVMVGGAIAWRQGQATGAGTGRFLRRQAPPPAGQAGA